MAVSPWPSSARRCTGDGIPLVPVEVEGWEVVGEVPHHSVAGHLGHDGRRGDGRCRWRRPAPAVTGPAGPPSRSSAPVSVVERAVHAPPRREARPAPPAPGGRPAGGPRSSPTGRTPRGSAWPTDQSTHHGRTPGRTAPPARLRGPAWSPGAPTGPVGRDGTTATPTDTGPAHAPRPTSSSPAMRRKPSAASAPLQAAVVGVRGVTDRACHGPPCPTRSGAAPSTTWTMRGRL